MVKLTGPMFSMSARGTIGNAATYATSIKGTSYAKRKPRPRNPQTRAQIAQRQMFSFISKNWFRISQVNQAAWESQARIYQASRFTAFTRTSLDNWRSFLPPSQTPTRSTTATQAVISQLTVTGGVEAIQFNFAVSPVNQSWGIIVFVSTTSGFTSARIDTRAVRFFNNSQIQRIKMRVPQAGTYFVRYRFFATNGALGTQSAQNVVTVTAG